MPRAVQAISITLAAMLAACRTAAPPPPPDAADAAEAADAEAPALWFGGDVHLGEAPPTGGLAAIAAMVGGAAGVVNLEGPIAAGAGGARVEGGRVWLANPAATPAFLREAGVVAASVANNHAGDDGAEGAARTIARLEQGGVAPVGGAAAAADLEVGGVPVRLVAYDLPPGAPDGAAPAGDGVPSALARDLAGSTALTVVSLHVTGPPSYLPRPELVAAVDAAVGAGADVVVAHGTHVVGPVERRGSAVVAWGLGNLLFDCACTDADEALVLRVELTPGLPTRVLPVTAGLDGPARAAADPDGILDLVDALGGTPLRRLGGAGGL